MSFIANLLALINWNIRRRTHNHGGDDSAVVIRVAGENDTALKSEREEPDRPEFGLEFLGEEDTPTLGVLHDRRARRTAFTNNQPGCWISANDSDVIDRRKMQ